MTLAAKFPGNVRLVLPLEVTDIKHCCLFTLVPQHAVFFGARFRMCFWRSTVIGVGEWTTVPFLDSAKPPRLGMNASPAFSKSWRREIFVWGIQLGVGWVVFFLEGFQFEQFVGWLGSRGPCPCRWHVDCEACGYMFLGFVLHLAYQKLTNCVDKLYANRSET